MKCHLSSSSSLGLGAVASVLLLVGLLASTPQPTLAQFRDFYNGNPGDAAATTGPTSFVWDPELETIVITATGFNNPIVWRWHPRSTAFYHLAFSGVLTGVKQLDASDGRNSNMGITAKSGTYGVTLAINSGTGAIFGYLVTMHLVHVIALIQRLSPHGVTEVAGEWEVPGDVQGAKGVHRLSRPLGMCSHRNSRRMWLAGGLTSRLTELVWNAGHTALSVAYVAGNGLNAALADGVANAAEIGNVAQCEAYPQSEATPAAIYFTDYNRGRLSRLAPLPTDPSVVFTTSIVTTIFNNGGATNFASKFLSIVEYPGLTTAEINFGYNGIVGLRGAYRFKIDRSWAATTPSLVPVPPIVALVDAETIGGGSLPNGTMITLRDVPVRAGIRVWGRGSFFAGTVTTSRTITPCGANPSQINSQLQFPSGAIAPVTDSIFDFRTYQNLCCADVTDKFAWADTCRTNLHACTVFADGATLHSAPGKWLLYGSFDTTAHAEKWASECVIAYLDCMKAGVIANPPPNHPTCGWGGDARKKLQDPTECQIFVTAALTGMNAVESIKNVDQICSGFFNFTVPDPPPADAPAGVNELVASLPKCAAPYSCPRPYPGASGSEVCNCPTGSTKQFTISVFPAQYGLPSTHPEVASKGGAFDGCRLEPGEVKICTSKDALSTSWISAHVREVLDVFANTTNAVATTQTHFKFAGSCVPGKENSFTGRCTCPANTTAFEYAVPQDDGEGSAKMRIVTFCMPAGLATFFVGRTDWQTDGSKPFAKCVHPFGKNYSCECAKYTSVASTRRIPVSIYQDRHVGYTTPGEWVFCGSDQTFPDEIDPAIVGTTIGVTIIGGVMGGSLAVLQAAAVMMTMCADNKSNSSRSMVSFAKLDAAGEEASHFAFMAGLGIVIILAHWAATCLYCLLLICCVKGGLPNWETGFIDTQLDEKPDLWELWLQACYKTRFPHWSCMFLRVVFPGFVLESAYLFQSASGNTTLTVLGVIGIGLASLWMVLTLYFSWWGLAAVAPDVIMQSIRVDLPQDAELAKQSTSTSSNKYQDAEAAAVAADAAVLDSSDPDTVNNNNNNNSNNNNNKNNNAGGENDGGALKEFDEWDDGDWIERPNINTLDVDGGDIALASDPLDPAGTLAHRRVKQTISVDADGKLMRVRMPPYFTWFTHKATLNRYPAWLNFIFVPRGWWTQRRPYSRRYATFYNSFMPRANRWCPTLMQGYMYFISAIAVSEGCEVPMSVIGGVNIAMMVILGVTAPFRRPMETFFMVLQFAAASALAFSRGQGWAHNGIFFQAIMFIALSTLVHHGAVQAFEMLYAYDGEMARFHNTDLVKERSMMLLKNGGVNSSGGTARSKYADVTVPGAAEDGVNMDSLELRKPSQQATSDSSPATSPGGALRIHVLSREEMDCKTAAQ